MADEVWLICKLRCRTVQCSRSHCDIDPHMYYPRCFELSDDLDMTAFSVEFKWTAAEAIVKRVLADGGFSAQGVPNLETLKAAKSICQRRACFARWVTNPLQACNVESCHPECNCGCAFGKSGQHGWLLCVPLKLLCVIVERLILWYGLRDKLTMNVCVIPSS